jgi:hypothetical protein
MGERFTWPEEDGSASFRIFLVIIFLTLVWAWGAAVLGTRLRLEADLEGLGWFYVAEPLELFRLKCAIDRRTTAISPTHFKRNNPLVCRVSARYNHGSARSKQVYLARRRVHITE